MLKRKSAFQKELEKLSKKEEKYNQKRIEKNNLKINDALADKIPKGLQDTLDKAFLNAFNAIFKNGTTIIEKTYSKEKTTQNFMINDYALNLNKNKKSLKVFTKNVNKTEHINMLISGVSGMGLGVLGIGLPDIILFTSILIKNIYQIALNYGYDYNTEQEKQFILLLIQGAICDAEQFISINNDVNYFIDNNCMKINEPISCTIQKTSKIISKELLYIKFLQGIPLIGIIGGGYNIIFIKKITEYAKFKYHKRFLKSKFSID